MSVRSPIEVTLPDRPRARLTAGQAELRLRNYGGGKAGIWLYDEIGPYGVTAARFVEELQALAGVSEIELHVNSPGGDVFDGIAITNALRQHPARVVATVDGMAASAASFIVMAADDLTMARQSQLMIHDAHGVGIGNAEVMRDLAERMDQVSDTIASIYAERAGGELATWRTAMRAETWYTAQEAVDAKLADRVEGQTDSPTAKWDLSPLAARANEPAATPATQTPAPAPAPAASFDWRNLFHGAFEEANA